MNLQIFTDFDNSFGLIVDMETGIAISPVLSCWCLGPDDGEEILAQQERGELPGCVEADMRLAAFAEHVGRSWDVLTANPSHARVYFERELTSFLVYEREHLFELYARYANDSACVTGDEVFQAWINAN